MQVLSVTRVLTAPIGQVWAITSAFGAIRAWMPGVTACSVEGAGLGALRTVSLRSGGTSVERLDELDAASFRVRYAITSPGMTVSKGLVGGTDLEALDNGRTRLTWIVDAEELENPDAIRPFLESFILENIGGLAALLGCGLEES